MLPAPRSDVILSSMRTSPRTRTSRLFPGFPALTAACLAFSGCLLDKEVILVPLPVESAPAGTYEVKGKSLIMTSEKEVHHFCLGDERREYTWGGTSDTLEYEIRGAVLSLFENPVPDDPETMAIEPTVQPYSEWDRVGKGQDVQGTWRLRGFRYRVLWGELGDSLEAVWEWRVNPRTLGIVHGIQELEFRNGQVLSRVQLRWADLFLASWNGDMRRSPFETDNIDSAIYAIQVKILDPAKVELTGKVTGEVVRISFSAVGTASYSSNREGHLPYASDFDPPTCPYPPGILWYYEFQEDHRKLSASKAVFDEKQAKVLAKKLKRTELDPDDFLPRLRPANRMARIFRFL